MSAILLLMVAMVVLFRVGYEQSGNVIALWVSDFTDRSIDLFGLRLTIPATWFQSINPLLIILGTPIADPHSGGAESARRRRRICCGGWRSAA